MPARRQRATLSSLPEREAELLGHYTPSDEVLEHMGAHSAWSLEGSRKKRADMDASAPARRLPVRHSPGPSGALTQGVVKTVDDLNACGIHLVSLEEPVDISSAAGEFVFHVFGAIAHFERRLISERTRDGIAAAR